MADSAATKRGERPIVGTATPIQDLARKLRDERLSAVVISDNDGAVVSGIVTERDICKSILSLAQFDIDSLKSGDCSKVTAADIMTADPICAKQSCPPEKLISVMLSRKFRHLPVVNNKREFLQLLDILTISKVITGELSRQKKTQQSKHGWWSKALGMISAFVENTFKSKRSILSMLDSDIGLQHKFGRKLDCSLSAKSSVAKAIQRMERLGTTALLVEKDFRLVGILTERDIVTKVVALGPLCPH